MDGYNLYPIGPKLDIITGALRVDTLSARIAGGARKQMGGTRENKNTSAITTVSNPVDVITNHIGNGECIGKCKVNPVIEKIKDDIGAENYRKVLEKLSEKGDATHAPHIEELKKQLKPPGPIDTTWLSNFNIEDVLSLFSKNPEHKFVAFKCELRDFDNGGQRALDKFECKTDWCYGIVLNTDKSPGRGEHWVAVFADLRSPDRWTVEYFNSGKNTFPEFAKLITDWADKLRAIDGAPAQIDAFNVVKNQLQYDNTECGVYSLSFVIGRVIGIPSEAFSGNEPIPFEKINALRKTLFSVSK